MRGFDPDEVQSFMDTVAAQWTELLQDISTLNRKVQDAEAELRSVKQVEEMQRKTLILAEESSKQLLENAKREAELMLKEAQVRATQMIDGAKNEMYTVADDIQRLQMQKHEIVSKLKVLLSSQLEILGAYDTKDDEMIMSRIASRRRQKAEEAESARDAAEAQVQQAAASQPAAVLPMPTLQHDGQSGLNLDSFVPKRTTDAAAPVPQQAVQPAAPRPEPLQPQPLPQATPPKPKKSMNIDDFLNELE